MPSALVDEAKRLRFPLIGLSDEVPFVEVSAQVHEVMADLVNADLIALEKLNAEFIQLLLSSQSHISFTETLAHYIGFPVVVENASHDVVAYAGSTAETDNMVRNWGLHARVGTHVDKDGEAPLFGIAPGHEPGCTRRIIALRGEAWGWIHVLHGEGSLSSVHSSAVSRAADAIAITLLGDRESGARSSQRQSSLLNRRLAGDISGEHFVDRALRIGRDLRDRPLAVVVVCKGPDSDVADGTLDTVLRPLRVPIVQADLGEHLLAVLGLTKQLSASQVIKHLNQTRVRAGVSRTCAANQLPEAIRQARTAASVAARHEQPITVHFDRLGVLRLLVALDQGPELRRYVEDELGVLIAHDASEANPLMPTLRAYLACDGNKSKTADALFVQRRTLYYRLERINALLGRSVEDPEARVGLDLAVRGLDFLQPKPPHSIA